MLFQYCDAFIAVAELQSFTRAADALNMTKGGVSQAIRQLESQLSVRLFFRTTRKVSLTDEGKLFYKQCQRLKREMDGTLELVSQFHQAPSGLLRICSNPHLAKAKLIKLIDIYLARFPDVDIELLCDERMPDMIEEQVDIVFGINWPAPEDVVAKVIDNTRYVLCASPAYLEKHGMPTCIEALSEHNYIPHLGRDPNTPLMHIDVNSPFQLDKRLAVNNISTMLALAEAGIGIIQVHQYAAKSALASGRLLEILPELSKPNIPLYVYYQKHRFVQPKVRQFLNLVIPTL